MEHEDAGCQASERPILCINNCGFFGSSATMNMCSKCHKDHVLKQEQTKLAASSIDSAVNGSGSSTSNEVAFNGNLDISVGVIEPIVNVEQTDNVSALNAITESKGKEGPNRCNTCKKRVGLTGFSCRCGNLFCAAHRYSDKHDCQFNYRMAARDAIAKANPVVKAEKLDKI